MPVSEWFRYRHHRLGEWILELFELLPIRLSLGLIPDGEALAVGSQSQPDIPALIALAHAEGFVEKRYPTIVGDAPDSMDLARADRERIGYVAGLTCRQSSNPIAAAQLNRGRGLTWGNIVAPIPFQEGALHAWDISAP